MAEHVPSHHADSESVDATTAPPPVAASLDPSRIDRRLRNDRAGLLLAIVLSVLVAVLVARTLGLAAATAVAPLLGVGLWLMLGLPAARAAGRGGAVVVVAESDPAAAEAMLSRDLSRRLLIPRVRVMLYHGLAVVRRLQERPDEASAVVAALLSQDQVDDRLRARLNLMLAELRLDRGDAWGTWAALAPLSAAPLDLPDALRSEALQTVYAVMVGRPDVAVHDWQGKATRAELLDLPLTRRVHGALADAAEAVGLAEPAAWLASRWELLGGEMADESSGAAHAVDPSPLGVGEPLG
jgi:hypothetical protein